MKLPQKWEQKVKGLLEQKVHSAKKVDTFLQELISSSLLPAEKFDVLRYRHLHMNMCKVIASMSDTNNKAELFKLLASLRNSGVDPNAIAALILPEIFEILFDIEDVSNVKLCLAFIQELGVNRKFISQRPSLDLRSEDWFIMLCRRTWSKYPSTFYQLAESGLLRSYEFYLTYFKDIFLRHILTSLPEEEKKAALGRCLVKETPLGKIFWDTLIPFIKNSIKEDGNLRNIFKEYFGVDPITLSEKDINDRLASIPRENSSVATATVSSSSTSSASSSNISNADLAHINLENDWVDLAAASSSSSSASSSSSSKSKTSDSVHQQYLDSNSQSDFASKSKNAMSDTSNSIHPPLETHPNDIELRSCKSAATSNLLHSSSTSTASMLVSFESQPTTSASSNSSCVGITTQPLATSTNVITTAPASSLSSYQSLAVDVNESGTVTNFPAAPEHKLENEELDVTESIAAAATSENKVATETRRVATLA